MDNILFIDNRDSFAYNIVEMLRQFGISLTVVTDCLSGNVHGRSILDGIMATLPDYSGIVLSPGAGIPAEYPIMQTILHSGTDIPILGVCLGHQAIAEAAGAILTCMPQPHHGHTSRLKLAAYQHPIFYDVPDNSPIGRYHSWVVDKETLPHGIRIIATDEDGNIQAIAHRTLPRIGLQFHPESVITAYGRQIIGNWLSSIDKNK